MLILHALLDYYYITSLDAFLLRMSLETFSTELHYNTHLKTNK
jgi:hypothetical protein